MTRNSTFGPNWILMVALAAVLALAGPASAQVYQYPAACSHPGYACYQHHGCDANHGFYTTDGRNVFYFPYGFPRSVHRHTIYAGYGPDFRFSTRYRWTSRHSYRPFFCHQASQMQFQGPYWTHTSYRAARGLFHRSTWKCAWIPYYVAAIPSAPVLGVPPTGQLPAPGYPAPLPGTLPRPATVSPTTK